MNNSYLFSFIIGYRHRQDRIQNLRRVIDWLSGFGGIEIIIVEQDKAIIVKPEVIENKPIIVQPEIITIGE